MASGRTLGAFVIPLGIALSGLIAPPAAVATTSIVTTLPGGNPFQTAVNPITNRVYVSDAGGLVHVIDGNSNIELTTIGIPFFCRGIAVNPTTNKIYVAANGNGTGDKLHVINGATSTLLPDIDIYPPNDPPFGSGPYGVAVNPGNNRVYVGTENPAEVAIVDGSTDTLITRVPAGGVVRGIGVHTGTNRVYVSTQANFIRVLNFDGTFVTDILGMNAPHDLVVDSLANRVYVVNYSGNTLSVIDTTSNTVINTMSAGIQPQGLAVNPARSRAYITGGQFGSNVYVVNLITGGTEENLSIGLDARDAEYDPVNDMIYVTTWTNTLIYVMQDVGEVCTAGIESWWNTSWRRRRSIDINNGDIGETFTDFPLLVKLDTSRIDYTKTKPGGDDLRFVAADDVTVLDYEIESWNPGGTSWIWVRIPTLTGTSSTRINMYFDNPAAAVGANPAGVWNANHGGVWHLKENPGGAPPQMKDSTANANHGTANNSPVQVAGQINGSLSFDGTIDREVNIPDSASVQMPTQMTISGWGRTINVDAQARLMVARWNTTGPSMNYWLGKLSTTQIAFGADGGGASTVFCPIGLVSDGAWHYWAGVAEAGGTLRLYIDGTQCSTAGFAPPLQVGSSPVKIGRSPDATLQDWDGGIDEVRVESVARTPLWLKAQDRSMRDGYNTFGSEDGICNLRSIGGPAVYSTGQAVPTIGSRTVNGIGGTTWRTANRGRGDRITIGAYTGTILSVDSETQLTMTTPSTVGGAQAYTISRKFTSLAAWESCIDGSGGCGADPAVTASLVTDNRGEMGIVYDDVVLAGPLVIDGTVATNTDAIHTITLTADNINRHYGRPGNGVVIDNGLNNTSAIKIRDDYVTVEWMEIRGGSGGIAHGIEVEDFFISPGIGAQGASRILIRNNLIHVPNHQILLGDEDQVVDVYNNFTYGGTVGVRYSDLATWGRIRAFNNTFYNYSTSAFDAGSAVGADRLTIRNNLAAATSNLNDFALQGNPHPSSSNNMSATHVGGYAFDPNPAGPACCSLFGHNLDTQVRFVDRLAVNPNLHIFPLSTATNAAAALNVFFKRDIDDIARSGAWDIGADDTSSTTAVTLESFTATGGDGAVDLAWTTASELQNLGFHVYRATAASGPWTRATSTIIPGLGSSPTGQSYAWRDGGLANGTTYYYLLEDVETTGRTERRGPVSATPGTGAPVAGDGDPQGTAYGDPRTSSLRVLERTEHGVVLELRTGGFYAVPEGDGVVRVEVPGFEESAETGLPVKRGVVEAVAGAKVRLVSVESSEETRYGGLRPVGPRKREIVAREDGTLDITGDRRARRRAQEPPPAQLEATLFQGETKKARVLFSPFRFEGEELLLSGRIRVRLEFAGRETGETAKGGGRGRRPLPTSPRTTGVFAHVVVGEAGLYRVAYEDVFGTGEGRRRPIAASRLRLSRKGEAVPYHLTPDGSDFGPGSVLVFLSGETSRNLEGETVYELEEGAVPSPMELVATSAEGPSIEEYEATATLEENRYYQAGLLEADDLWQWDLVVSPGVLTVPFALTEVAPSASPGGLTVWLQGGSDFEASPDHHLRIRVNGLPVGETSFEGRRPSRVDVQIPRGTLREGGNELAIENVGDTGAAYSMVFLNRFSVRYPRRVQATERRLEGAFDRSGRVEVPGLSPSSILVDTTGEAPRWVSGVVKGAQGVAFGAKAGHRYLLTDSPRRPVVRTVAPSALRSGENRADYLVVGPRAFLAAAQPLLDHRRSQGLVVKAVSTEEIFQEFGHGEPSAQSIREFLFYAYQKWTAPSVRYVLLLGDATYDPQHYLGPGAPNPVPALTIPTSYLWTASDPTYAAVNGDDSVPDVALGRLSAASVDEVRVLVEKVLAFENGGQDLQGRAVLVADNPDTAGNFEQDADEIAATILASRDRRKIYYSQEGANTRTRIEQAFDDGASLLSYVGHGGTAVWASENIFNNQDVAALAAQPAQPLLVTLNCLNGFFHFPPMDSLSEALLKAEGRGAVAAFSPSGLSQNGPAHVFHKALLAEIVSGRHERLGDAVLAAQALYANSGFFPELLSIYNLLGDPALKIR